MKKMYVFFMVLFTGILLFPSNLIAQCNDMAACNYDDLATEALDCVYPSGCEECSTDVDGNAFTDGSGAIISNDDDGDGICNDDEVLGCTDDTACNYDATATDDGDCVYAAEFYDCDGNCLVDTDGDGVCDELEAVGCTDDIACNYDATATDDGDCVYAAEFYDCDGNCLVDTDGDGVCDELEVFGCQDSMACNYNSMSTEPAECEGTVGCNLAWMFNYDPDADCISNEMYADNELCTDWNPGCTDDTACNYNMDAAGDDGSCVYAEGCDECALDAEGNPITDGSGSIIDNDADDDGVCNNDEIIGCMDETACNYSEIATDDSGLCIFAGVDPNENGTVSDCDYCSGSSDGSGYIIDNDVIGGSNGECDDVEFTGCMDVTACNYNPTALTDDGSCDDDGYIGCNDPAASNYTPNADCFSNAINDYNDICTGYVYGCTNQNACNYNPFANADDNSCVMPGCIDMTYCNYDPDAGCDDGSCDTVVGCNLEWMSNYDPSSACFENAVLAENENCQDWSPGCIDSTACNYNESANTDDGSCTYARCMLSDGSWIINDYGMQTAAITGSGDNWSFSSASIVAVDTTYNFDENGDLNTNLFSFTQTWAAYGENTSFLTSDCFDGEVMMTVSFDADSTGTFLTDFTFTMTGQDFIFSSMSQLSGFDFVAITASGTVSGNYTNIESPVSLGCETCSTADENGMMTIMMLDENGTGTADCDDVYGCMIEEACNYNAAATVDNEECVYISYSEELMAWCDECCKFSAGDWVIENYPSNPTLSATGDDWELVDGEYVSGSTEEYEGGSTSTVFFMGAIQSNCYTGMADISISFSQSVDTLGNTTFSSEPLFTINGYEFSMSSNTSVPVLENGSLTGTISGGNAGSLSPLDDDNDGLPNCEDDFPNIELEENDLRFDVYPNPANDYIVVNYSLDIPNDVTIRIINSLGQLVDTKIGYTQSDIMFDVSDYVPGLYQVTLISDNEIINKSIIVK